MKRRYIVLSMALGLLAYASPFSLAQEASRANPASQQADDPSCDNCTSHAIDLGPRSNGQVARLLVPDNVPLDFSALHMDFENGGVRGGSFLLKNSSSAGLVTLVISWSFQGDGPPPREGQATTMLDSWVTDAAFLQVGSEQRESLTFQILNRSGEAWRRATGTVLYAEFDDGTRVGPGMNTVGLRLRSERTKILAACKELLDKVQSGSDPQTITVFLQTRPGLRWLREVYNREGLEGLVAETTKPRYLAP